MSFTMLATYQDTKQVLITADPVTLRFLALQLSMNLIQQCKERPQTQELQFESENTSVRALTSQASWLYAYVGFALGAPSIHQIQLLVDRESLIPLITTALSTFRKWRDKHWWMQQDYHKTGQTTPEFFERDWTNLNRQLTALLKKAV